MEYRNGAPSLAALKGSADGLGVAARTGETLFDACDLNRARTRHGQDWRDGETAGSAGQGVSVCLSRPSLSSLSLPLYPLLSRSLCPRSHCPRAQLEPFETWTPPLLDHCAGEVAPPD